jgi:hypothetical protein
MKIYYTVYKITNNINGKIYVGMHKTTNLDDGYYGSGKLIKLAIDKYGIRNFTKEYLAIFDDEAEMVSLEKFVVDESFVDDPDTYNLIEGGVGGWATTFKKRLEVDPDFKSQHKLRGVAHGKINGKTSFKGRHHKKSSKDKIGQANSKHQKGEGNSQYGTCWIHSLTLKESKRISKEDLNDWTSKGWIKGRKMKF